MSRFASVIQTYQHLMRSLTGREPVTAHGQLPLDGSPSSVVDSSLSETLAEAAISRKEQELFFQEIARLCEVQLWSGHLSGAGMRLAGGKFVTPSPTAFWPNLSKGDLTILPVSQRGFNHWPSANFLGMAFAQTDSAVALLVQPAALCAIWGDRSRSPTLPPFQTLTLPPVTSPDGDELYRLVAAHRFVFIEQVGLLGSGDTFAELISEILALEAWSRIAIEQKKLGEIN